MKARLLAAGLCMVVAHAAHAITLKHLDLLVGLSNGSNAGIYVVDLTTGQIKGLFSGRGMKPSWPQPDPSRGSGPALSTLPGIITTRDGRVFASAIGTSSPAALVQIAASTGDRSQVSQGWPSVYSGAGALGQIDQRTTLVGTLMSASPFSSTKIGSLYAVDLISGAWTLAAGGLSTDGPAFGHPMSVAVSDHKTAFVADLESFGVQGPAVFRIDLSEPAHSILTVPFNAPIWRYSVTNGQASESPTVFLPSAFGSGPTCSDYAYRMAMIGGDLYEVESSFSEGRGSGIIRIDQISGDRTLVLGKALNSEGQVIEAPPSSAPANFGVSDPAVLHESPSGEMLIGEWDPYGRILAFDIATRNVRVIASFADYFQTTSIPVMRSMAIYTNCPADINLDGFADDADFTRFVVAYDILDCADDAMPVPCPADLNADGVVDDSDFQIFVIGYDALICG